MNKKRATIISAFSVSLLSLAFVGSTFAAWAVNDNAGTKHMHIMVASPTLRTITYYLPNGSGGFTSNSKTVEDGADLYTSLSSYTSNIGGYSFDEWHWDNTAFPTYSSNYSNKKISEGTTVTSDITVYAKYIQNNVGYYNDGSDHYLTSSQELSLNTQHFFYGTRIYSVTGIDGADIDLTTSSGKYHLVKNANNWTVNRYVKIGINDVSSWWPKDSKSFVYLFGASDDATSWTGNISFSSNKATIEVDAKYTKFIVTRNPSNTASGTFNGAWNQTVDVSLTGKDTGSQTYSSTYDTIYIQDNKDGASHQHINWWS